MRTDMLIPPPFSLPMKPPKRWEIVTKPLPGVTPMLHKPKKRSLLQRLKVGLYEIFYLLLSIEIGNLAFHYLAPWPVYRVVAFVVLLILWANFASASVRDTSPGHQIVELYDTMSLRAVPRPSRTHKVQQHEALNQDTTTYLATIRKEFEQVV